MIEFLISSQSVVSVNQDSCANSVDLLDKLLAWFGCELEAAAPRHLYMHRPAAKRSNSRVGRKLHVKTIENNRKQLEHCKEIWKWIINLMKKIYWLTKMYQRPQGRHTRHRNFRQPGSGGCPSQCQVSHRPRQQLFQNSKYFFKQFNLNRWHSNVFEQLKTMNHH